MSATKPVKTAPNFVELVLTCGSWQEAQRIVDHLLEQKLIACAKFLPIEYKSWLYGELGTVKEVKLFMESLADKFEQIESEVAALHSYTTFVLQSVPIMQVSSGAAAWVQYITGQSDLTNSETER